MATDLKAQEESLYFKKKKDRRPFFDTKNKTGTILKQGVLSDIYRSNVVKAGVGVSNTIGKGILSMPGGYAGFALYDIATGRDAYTKTRAQHAFDTTLSTIGDATQDTLLFGVGALAGGWGTAAALGTSIFAHASGLNIGRMVGDLGDYAKQRSKGKAKPITQNEQTVRATEQGLAMLGQQRRHSMLGQESLFMHN